jgi:hypothetical protein
MAALNGILGADKSFSDAAPAAAPQGSDFGDIRIVTFGTILKTNMRIIDRH